MQRSTDTTRSQPNNNPSGLLTDVWMNGPHRSLAVTAISVPESDSFVRDSKYIGSVFTLTRSLSQIHLSATDLVVPPDRRLNHPVILAKMTEAQQQLLKDFFDLLRSSVTRAHRRVDWCHVWHMLQSVVLQDNCEHELDSFLKWVRIEYFVSLHLSLKMLRLR